MILFLYLFFSTNFCYLLQLPPGVMSQGLGGITTLLDEGLAVFHNPALFGGDKLNFTLSRWLYNTNLASLGGIYKNYSFGINYLGYGIIQGYDEFGIPTRQFSPYDLTVAGGIKVGSLGFDIKFFQERIDSLSLFALCGGVSSYLNLGRISIGSKIDDLGREFTYNMPTPLTVINGMGITLIDSLNLFLEGKAPEIELKGGLLYWYRKTKIFGGIRYMKPQMGVKSFRAADLGLSGGILIKLEEYEIGYSFVWTQFATAHQFSIIFTPSGR